MKNISPIISEAADAAIAAYHNAKNNVGLSNLRETHRMGKDGTPTKLLDELVESAVIEKVDSFDINILSEEEGFIDKGSSVTLIIDPVDGTGNATTGIPFSAFTAALVKDSTFIEGYTYWFEGDKAWWAKRGESSSYKTSYSTQLTTSTISMIRPKGNGEKFLKVAKACHKIRILGSSAIEGALVAEGSLDAALDPGSNTHRIVDLAAAKVFLEAAGGVLVDLNGRPFEYTTDITQRWSGVCAASEALAEKILELLSNS